MSSKNKPSRSRLLRFSLRSVMVLIVLAALMSNWWRLAERQRRITEKLAGEDIKVVYDFQLSAEQRDPNAVKWLCSDRDQVVGIRHWLADRLGPDAVGRVTHVEGYESFTRDEQLALVDQLGTLRSLWIDNTNGELDLLRYPCLKDLYAMRFYAGPSDARHLSTFKQLRNLDLSGYVDDFQPLAALHRLRVFSFYPHIQTYRNSHSFELAPLGGNRELRELRCEIGLSDIAMVSKFRQLRKLSVGGKVNDLSPVKNLNRLAELNVVGERLSDLSPLKGLNLTTLSLQQSDSGVTDIDCIQGMSELESIRLLGFSNLKNIRGLAKCNQLKTVWMTPSDVSDLTPLSSCERIRRLDIGQSKVVSLQPLEKLSALYQLDISGSRVTDLGPLTSLKSLRDLNASDCPIEDIEPLREIGTLTSLNLANTKVQKIDALPSSIRKLNLNGIPATDFSGLRIVPEWYELQLANTGITDISPLASSKGLGCLVLANTGVSDLSPLAAFKNLYALDLTNCPVSDITALAGATSLEYLSLRGTRVTDLSPLASMKSFELNGIDISHTRVSDLKPLTRMIRMTNITSGYVMVFAKDVPTLSQEEIDAFEQNGSGEVFRDYGQNITTPPWE